MYIACEDPGALLPVNSISLELADIFTVAPSLYIAPPAVADVLFLKLESVKSISVFVYIAPPFVVEFAPLISTLFNVNFAAE